jgi:hypothetical protein
MRAGLFTAVIVGILFLPLYAQTPEPETMDTTEQMAIPEMTEEMEESTEMAEPDLTEEMGEPEETGEMGEIEKSAAMAANLTVKEMTFCDGVEDREPVTMDSTFSSEVGKIYFWSNILNDDGETYVEHVWYRDGEEMARVSLPAKYSRNRIWSSKTILPEWTGEWTVKIMAGQEKLGEMSCTVE